MTLLTLRRVSHLVRLLILLCVLVCHTSLSNRLDTDQEFDQYDLLMDDGVCRWGGLNLQREVGTSVYGAETPNDCRIACESKYGRNGCLGFEWDEIGQCEMYVNSTPDGTAEYPGEFNMCFAKATHSSECTYLFGGLGSCRGDFQFSHKKIVDYENCKQTCNKDVACTAFEWHRRLKRCRTFRSELKAIVIGGTYTSCFVKKNTSKTSCVTSIAPENCASPNTTQCDLSNKELSSLTGLSLNWEYVKNLDLSENNLAYLPGEFFSRLKSLTKLTLNDNALEALPPQIGRLSSLTFLDLARNKLQSLPYQFGNLSSLKSLRISENMLTAIPQLEMLTSLRFLEVFDNILEMLPPQLSNLKHLTHLDVRHNRLTELQPQIKNNSQIKYLYLDDNQLSVLPSQLGDLRDLVWLLISENNLTDIPSQIGRISRLVTLQASKNPKIRRVPSQLGNLGSLTQLDLINNTLQFLPSQIGKLRALEKLNLRMNMLTQLPSQFSLLTSLEHVDVSTNKISSVPSLVNLTLLKTLDVSKNTLRIFKVEAWENMLSLNVADNYIADLPTEIGYLRKLTGLLMQNNSLLHLPSELGMLNSISSIRLGNNPFIVCDCRLLSWFRNFIVRIDDTDLFDMSPCSDVNEYSGVYPFILQSEKDAPCSHSIIDRAVKRTSTTLIVTWNQPLLFQERENYLNGSFFIPLAGEFPYVIYTESEWKKTFTFQKPSDETIGEFFNVSKQGRPLNPYYDITTAKLFGEKEKKAFRNCETFLSSYPSGFSFGFKIEWSKRNESKSSFKRCVWASEVENLISGTTSLTSFSFEIKDLRPSESYVVSIRPFRVYFGISPILVENELSPPGFNLKPSVFVFGIRSISLTSTTLDGRPLVAPSNIISPYIRSNDVTAEWDEIDSESAQGVIIGYDIRVFDKHTGKLHGKTYNAEIRRADISLLQPERFYLISVRAKTAGAKNESIQYGPWSQNHTFITCPQNMKKTLATKMCIASIGYYSISTGVKARAKPCSALSETLQESSCLTEGLTVRTLSLKQGYWRDSLTTDNMLKCPKSEFCSKSTFNADLKNPDQQCATNHRGVYCYECVEGFFLSSTGCEECSDEKEQQHHSRLVVCTVVLVIVFLAGIMKVALSVSSCKSCEKRVHTKGKDNKCIRESSLKKMKFIFNEILSVKIRTLFGFCQVVFAFNRTLVKRRDATNMGLIEAVVGLNPSSIAESLNMRCAFNFDHYDILVIYTTIPLIFIAAVAVVYLILSKVYSNCEERLRQNSLRVIFYLTFLIYPGVSQVTIGTFLCEEFPTANGKEVFKSTLRGDYSVSCEPSEKRTSALVYASIMTLVYPVGIVVLYITFLVRYYDVIQNQDKSDLECLDRMKLKRVSFLTRPYKPSAYWYETYELLRKLIQTTLPAFFQDSRLWGLSSLVATNTTVISIILLLFFSPYRQFADLLFALTSLVLLVVASQLTTLNLDSEQLNEGFNGIVVAEFVVLIAMVLFEVLQSYKNGSVVSVQEDEVVEEADVGRNCTDSVHDVDETLTNMQDETEHLKLEESKNKSVGFKMSEKDEEIEKQKLNEFIKKELGIELLTETEIVNNNVNIHVKKKPKIEEENSTEPKAKTDLQGSNLKVQYI